MTYTITVSSGTLNKMYGTIPLLSIQPQCSAEFRPRLKNQVLPQLWHGEVTGRKVGQWNGVVHCLNAISLMIGLKRLEK